MRNETFIAEVRSMFLTPYRISLAKCYRAVKTKYQALGTPAPSLATVRTAMRLIPANVIAQARG